MSCERGCFGGEKVLDITLLTRLIFQLSPRSSMRTPAHRSRCSAVPAHAFPLTLSAAPAHVFLLTMASSVAAQSSDPALEHARKLLGSAPLIDGHNDLPWEIRESKDAPRDVAAYDIRPSGAEADRPAAAQGGKGRGAVLVDLHPRVRSRTAATRGCSWSSSTSPDG